MELRFQIKLYQSSTTGNTIGGPASNKEGVDLLLTLYVSWMYCSPGNCVIWRGDRQHKIQLNSPLVSRYE